MDAEIIKALQEAVKDNEVVSGSVNSLIAELEATTKANAELTEKNNQLNNDLNESKSKLNSANVSILRMAQENTKTKSFKDMVGGIM